VAEASIWVDADACPNVIKEILFAPRAHRGRRDLGGESAAADSPHPSLRAVRVSSGFDVATGDRQARHSGRPGRHGRHSARRGVIAKGGEALNPRGERYSPDTIRGILAMRDFLDTCAPAAMWAAARRAHAGEPQCIRRAPGHVAGAQDGS